jgi:hypothetical protein
VLGAGAPGRRATAWPSTATPSSAWFPGASCGSADDVVPTP